MATNRRLDPAIVRSGASAIRRQSLSAPLVFILAAHGCWVYGLDFGCGHGFAAQMLGLEMYDPVHYPRRPRGRFDFIVCVYVLNTIPRRIQKDAVEEIRRFLTPNGTAYIAVRRDVPRRMRRGSIQRYVTLPGLESDPRELKVRCLPNEEGRSEVIKYFEGGAYAVATCMNCGVKVARANLEIVKHCMRNHKCKTTPVKEKENDG